MGHKGIIICYILSPSIPAPMVGLGIKLYFPQSFTTDMYISYNPVYVCKIYCSSIEIKLKFIFIKTIGKSIQNKQTNPDHTCFINNVL